MFSGFAASACRVRLGEMKIYPGITHTKKIEKKKSTTFARSYSQGGGVVVSWCGGVVASCVDADRGHEGIRSLDEENWFHYLKEFSKSKKPRHSTTQRHHHTTKPRPIAVTNVSFRTNPKEDLSGWVRHFPGSGRRSATSYSEALNYQFWPDTYVVEGSLNLRQCCATT